MSRKTAFAGSASGRRRERRAHLQTEVSSNSDIMHRPTPSRVVLQCKRQVMDRVTKAVETETEYRKQILAAAAAYTGPEFDGGAMCLPDVAVYSAGFRKSGPLTAR